MINAMHLFWILPLCAFITMLLTAFIISATIPNKEYEAYMQGIEYGKKLALKKCESNVKEG